MPDVNLPLPFEAYAGKEPFIFASYAHADGAAVFEDVAELHRRGYRIWYDEGIDPGNEWPEEIAKALDSAAWFLVFITRAAVRSRNVRNEINFALGRQKPFLAIYLEDCSLPPGLELQMGTLQAIMKWRMIPDHYWRKIAKVLSPELLQTPRADSASTVIEESLLSRLQKTRRPAPASTVGEAVPRVPSPAHDVFISYYTRDKAIADALCATLEDREIRCWIAPRDVPPGQTWAGALMEAIHMSRVFVLVLSNGSNRSSQVIREVGEAVDNGIPIIPLRIEDVQPSREISYYIEATHLMDALTPPLEQHLQRLGDRLETLLAGLQHE